MANKRRMRESREILAEMERIASRKDYLPAEKAVSIAGLLVRCFREDMFMIISCDSEAEAVSSWRCAETNEGKVYIAYTSEDRARNEKRGGTWAWVPCAEMIRKVMSAENVKSIAFNTDADSVMIPMQYLKMLIPATDL